MSPEKNDVAGWATRAIFAADFCGFFSDASSLVAAQVPVVPASNNNARLNAPMVGFMFLPSFLQDQMSCELFPRHGVVERTTFIGFAVRRFPSGVAERSAIVANGFRAVARPRIARASPGHRRAETFERGVCPTDANAWSRIGDKGRGAGKQIEGRQRSRVLAFHNRCVGSRRGGSGVVCNGQRAPATLTRRRANAKMRFPNEVIVQVDCARRDCRRRACRAPPPAR